MSTPMSGCVSVLCFLLRSVDDDSCISVAVHAALILRTKAAHILLTHTTMAKSLRSKSKRSFRSKKRESGKYAAAEAARLNRLNAKLAAVKEKDRSSVAPLDTEDMVEAAEDQQGSYDSEALFACLGLLHLPCVTPQILARFGFRGMMDWD